METLLEFLKQVEKFKIPDCDVRLLNNNKNKIIREFIQNVSELASEVLVGDNGQCL